MPIEMRTHGLDWRKKLRETDIFVAMVTPHWGRDRRTQQQYAYAQALGKPIVLLVQAGTLLPPNADTYVWRVWETVEELAQLVMQIEDGTLVP